MDPELGQKEEKKLVYRKLENLYRKNLQFYKQAAEDVGVRIEFRDGGLKENQRDNPDLMHMVTAEPVKFNFSEFYIHAIGLKRGAK